jgi:hypothetical protein
MSSFVLRQHILIKFDLLKELTQRRIMKDERGGRVEFSLLLDQSQSDSSHKDNERGGGRSTLETHSVTYSADAHPSIQVLEFLEIAAMTCTFPEPPLLTTL